MDNLQRIITAKDYSADERADGSVLGRIRKIQESWRRKNKMVQVNFPAQGSAVEAQINQGAWIGVCECGGAEFVAPEEPVFFCWGCVNRMNNGYVRPVTFPEDMAEIEAELIKRPVNDVRGVTDKDRAYLATPLVMIVDEEGKQYPATRSWVPGETVEDLQRQNTLIEEIINQEKSNEVN